MLAEFTAVEVARSLKPKAPVCRSILIQIACLMRWVFLVVISVLAASCDTAPEPPVPSDPDNIPKPRVVSQDAFKESPTGLKWYDFTAGAGDSTDTGDVLHVHYHGWLTDSTMFDSSYLRQEPYVFTLGSGQVIAGWDEGLLNMRVGGERQLIVPPDLAYGARARGPIPANSTLIFEVELVEIE